MKNKIALLLTAIVFILTFTGCSEDPIASKFETDINSFCADLADIDKKMNEIDPLDEDAPDQLLMYLDQLDQKFKVFAAMSFPEEYSYLEPLADDASTYMTTAVTSFHEAYSNNSFNEYTEEYAYKNYERACKRITVIVKLLNGEDISDEGVNVTVTDTAQ